MILGCLKNMGYKKKPQVKKREDHKIEVGRIRERSKH